MFLPLIWLKFLWILEMTITSGRHIKALFPVLKCSLNVSIYYIALSHAVVINKCISGGNKSY